MILKDLKEIGTDTLANLMRECIFICDCTLMTLTTILGKRIRGIEKADL